MLLDNKTTFELAAVSQIVCVCVAVSHILTFGLHKPHIYGDDL